MGSRCDEAEGRRSGDGEIGIGRSRGWSIEMR